MTPFDTALKADLQTLQHTVEYEGQNFRERDADGNTLLHCAVRSGSLATVSYTHLRAHETDSYLVCRLLLEKKKIKKQKKKITT